MSLLLDNIKENKIEIGALCGTVAASYAVAKCTPIFLKTGKQEVSNITNVANSILQKTNEFHIENLTDIKHTDLSNWPKILNPDASIVNGKNAACNILDKKIFINMKKLPLAVFHEIGHAYNSNNKILRCIQFLRIPLIFTSLFTALSPKILNKTPEWEKEYRTSSEKLKDGLINNAPIISALALTPILIEEGLASINACKFTKHTLKPHLYNKMLKGNMMAFSTYLLGSIGFSIVARLAQKTSD